MSLAVVLVAVLDVDLGVIELTGAAELGGHEAADEQATDADDAGDDQEQQRAGHAGGADEAGHEGRQEQAEQDAEHGGAEGDRALIDEPKLVGHDGFPSLWRLCRRCLLNTSSRR